MYEKCIGCNRLGKDCIPNLYVMSVGDAREWARKMKAYKGWTTADLSKTSGVAPGTISASFSKSCSGDVTYSTFAPILCALIDCGSAEMPCRDHGENEALKSQIDDLSSKNEALRNQIAETEKIHTEEIAMLKSENTERVDYMKEQLKWRKQMLIVAVIVACGALAIIGAALVIDWFNGAVGFFWYY